MTTAMHLVLDVEDDAGIRAVLRATLEAAGYRVVEATTAARAEVEARSHKPDIVLVDLGLPDRDGLELIAALRTWSPVPILVLSARDCLAVRCQRGSLPDQRASHRGVRKEQGERSLRRHQLARSYR